MNRKNLNLFVFIYFYLFSRCEFVN